MLHLRKKWVFVTLVALTMLVLGFTLAGAGKRNNMRLWRGTQDTHVAFTTPKSKGTHFQTQDLTEQIDGKSSSLSGSRKPGEVIMGKMVNETLKAELGRSAWRLLHTMAGKFPIEPTIDEQEAMRDFVYLFARLYPCGDCARHFKVVLEANPPDVTTRETISQWACKVHNVVNERLKKPIFDCAKLAETWKCGCAENEEEMSS
ncbi:hypothetical protein SpCBS45565_g07438 [Spizellomyces sp. 'palustris']|nr:hypothetical protein SpCBS45565_g07438 [Spizellomyces sp. 'palustris']